MPLYGEWTIPLQDYTQLEWNQQLNVLSRVATWARSFSRARSFSSSFLASCPSPPCCQDPFCTAAISHNCWGSCPVATPSSRCRTGRCPLAAREGRCSGRGSILGPWLCFFCCTKGIQTSSSQAVFSHFGKAGRPARWWASPSPLPEQETHSVHYFFPVRMLCFPHCSGDGEEGGWQTPFALLMTVVLPDFGGDFFCQGTAGLGQSSPCRYLLYCWT